MSEFMEYQEKSEARPRPVWLEISRPLEILVGVRSIALFLKISQRRALQLDKEGAPVCRDETGTFRAEKSELWQWWRDHYSGGKRLPA